MRIGRLNSIGGIRFPELVPTQIGPSASFIEIVVLWVGRTVILSFICSGLALLGVRVLDSITPSVHKRERIGEDPFASGMFIGGFFVFLGLVIHGAITAPMSVSGPVIENVFDATRLSLLAVGFLVSLTLAAIFFRLLDKLTPNIPFFHIRSSAKGISAYVSGYLVFLGLIINAALSTPV
jgi:hypothetical protein